MPHPPRRAPPLKPSIGALPDVRDGLTRAERVVVTVLAELERELGGRAVPTAMLYGRVVERLDMGVAELQAVLSRLARPTGAE